eukprot:2264941-Amphidinium_carterae.3
MFFPFQALYGFVRPLLVVHKDDQATVHGDIIIASNIDRSNSASQGFASTQCTAQLQKPNRK